jgi:hypothetical protein
MLSVAIDAIAFSPFSFSDYADIASPLFMLRLRHHFFDYFRFRLRFSPLLSLRRR